MARRFRIKELERQYGDLHQVIPPLVNQFSQAEAAMRLGVSSATISKWLKDNNYVLKLEYVKEKAS